MVKALRSEGLSRWELLDSWFYSTSVLTSWVNMLYINFSLSSFYKHSTSTVVLPQIQAWLGLSRQDRWFGLCRSLVFIPFSSSPHVPVQQLGSPRQAQGPGCLTQMAFILLNPIPPPLFPEHLSTDDTELNTPSST